MKKTEEIHSSTKKRLLPKNEQNIEREKNRRRRERFAIVIILILFLIVTAVEIQFHQLSQSLPFVNSIFFFGLVNLNVILILILLFLIFRAVVKLFIERRNKIVGSKLKSKLMIAFIAFSIVPTLLLFTISAFYINSSFDKWFSIRISQTFEDSIEIIDAYYKEAKRNSRLFAQNLITRIKYEKLYLEAKRHRLSGIIKWSRNEFNIDAFEYYESVDSERIIKTSEEAKDTLFPLAKKDFLEKGFSGSTETLIQNIKNGHLIRTVVPVDDDYGNIVAVVVANYYIPMSLISKLNRVRESSEDYKQVNPLKYPLKSIYFVILILMTLLIIFSGAWSGYYLAKEITTPIELISKGTEEVSQGNLGVVLEEVGTEELLSLIKAFNEMSVNLERKHIEVESSSFELEARKDYIETVLDNIDVGVISIDVRGVVTTFNKAAEKILHVLASNAVGKPISETLRTPLSALFVDRIEELKASGKKAIVKQVDIKVGDSRRTILIKLVDLYSKENLGCAILIDDVTDLQKAQRTLAWKEVAQRIAHEIKNPLTPIRLSAQRIRKRFSFQIEEGKDIFDQCTRSIIEQVDNLKILVNEFSDFAKLPDVKLTSTNIIDVIEPVYSMYKESNPRLRINLKNKLDGRSIVKLDSEQFKRALINVADNAIHVVPPKEGRIDFVVSDIGDLNMVRIEVLDNGPGVPENERFRLFEPYFSTKKLGTGLGLTIAKKIISEHNGYISAEDNKPRGMKFIIELPLEV